MLIKKSQAEAKSGSASCTVWEYALSSASFGHATALIHGRYPERGSAANHECEQLYYVISGTGTIHSQKGDFTIEAGDVYFFDPRESYHVTGDQLFVAMTNSPPWTPDQYFVTEE
jgi:mannose-6-phosphate isomerase-like protein (cupin superfamily)